MGKPILNAENLFQSTLIDLSVRELCSLTSQPTHDLEFWKDKFNTKKKLSRTYSDNAICTISLKYFRIFGVNYVQEHTAATDIILGMYFTLTVKENKTSRFLSNFTYTVRSLDEETAF
jgi:hypothetical protein